MSCEICARAQSSHLRFFCPTCARNQLYQLRVESSTVLLERECLGQQIEAAARPDSNLESPLVERREHNVALENGNARCSVSQSIAHEQARSSGRLKILTKHIEELKSQIKDKNFDISQRKLKLARRFSDSESAKYQLAEQEAAVLAGIQNNIKRTEHLWHSHHSRTAEARIFLCREVASLYSLRKKVRKKDNGLRELYMIGGVTIIDLRKMNSVSPEHISTSLSYIAHILVLVSHYLSLRLPAEIRLPDRNHPTPTIYVPSASYLPREAYSTSNPDLLYSSSPTSRTTDPRLPPPRPRPLCVDKALPKLAREDYGTYSLFIEGVTLLAWNVSWLCHSQGLNLGSGSWEDVCDIGKNMWQLLVAPPGQGQSATLIRTLGGRDTQSKLKSSKDSPRTTIQRTKSFPMLGHYSHGTAHSFLSSSDGTEFIRSWRLPTPTNVVDKLKSTLLGEMASAEWELLDETEWTGAPSESPQLLPHNTAHDLNVVRNFRGTITDTETIVSKLGFSDTPSSPLHPKGTSGWTKLRNR